MIKAEMVYTHPNADYILLNSFQIKKKRYKVLFKYDHIVWERLDTKRSERKNNESYEKKPTSSATTTEANRKADVEYEGEQVSQNVTYGCLSSVLYLHDIIRVSKGTTKSVSIRNAHKPLESADEFQNQQVTTPTEQYLSIYYAERVVASATDCNRWCVRRLTLHNNDPYIVAKWYDHLHKRLYKDLNRKVKRLLIFINPFGGRKIGLQIYERYCKQIVQLAGIDASCIITQRANQIRDILITNDLTPYDAVCCVGGDGTVAEMINGLILRTMRDQGLDLRRPKYIPKPALPIGIIPAGSTDTIVYSLHGTSDAQTAAIHLVLGQRRGLDICSVSNQGGIVRFCASVMGYGYLGDVAANSEKYRWMGTKRYEYTGVKAFLLNRSYKADISIRLSEEEIDKSASSTTRIAPYDDVICHAHCQRCKNEVYTSSCDPNDRPTSSNLALRVTETVTATNSMQANSIHSQSDMENARNFDYNICDKTYIKPMEKQTQFKDLIDNSEGIAEAAVANTSSSTINVRPEEYEENKETVQQHDFISTNMGTEKWRSIRGEFFMIAGVNITCACDVSPNGISRYCHLGDGYLDVMLVRKTSLCNNIRFLVNAMAHNGDVRNLPFVEVYRTSQFKFQAKSWPQHCNSVSGSCQRINENEDTDAYHKLYSSWNCDGEVLTDLEITMTSHRQLVDVFMRGPYIYNKEEKKSAKKSFFCCTCNE